MEDPIPNELDNALSLLVPAVIIYGNPQSSLYLDLKAFERSVQTAGCWEGLLVDKRGRRVLDERVAGQVEVAFRHCMHNASMAMAEIVSMGGNSSGCAAAAGSGARGVGIGEGGNAGGLGRGAGGLAKPKRPGGGGDSSEALEMSMPLGLLSLALEFVSTEVATSGRSIESALTGLPMVLLEDFLESQGRETCKEFWSLWVEPNSGRLTTPAMMQGGRYTLIRLCKKLAQRMSKTHDSSFCGQIHLFLSKAFGFFERSGLNVTGGVNHDNITAFEGEEQFRKAMWGFDGEEETPGGTGTGGASGDPCEVDSDAHQPQQEEFAVDYGLYQSFWRLQEYALKPDAAIKGDKTKDTWKAILHDVDKILGAFEANSFSEYDLRLARERWTAAASSTSSVSRGLSSLGGVSSKRKRGADAAVGMEGGFNTEGGETFVRQGEKMGGGGGGGYFGLKYLTSSRLLRLQLRDPTLRLQVLTQWLILAASLKNKVAKEKDSPNSGTDLNPRMERAKKLVKATPPRGEEYLGMLETVLQRESAWTKWKDVGKCNAVEPVADVEARALEGSSSAATQRGKKPRLLPTAVDAERAKRERATYAPLGPDFNLEKMATRLREVIPSADTHLEDQRMYAEDPETDPSELPSASPLYTWRALRLLSAEDPPNLAGCFDGDLIKVMARVDEARKAAGSTEAGASDSDAAVYAPTSVATPVPEVDASPKQPISSSAPGALAASSPESMEAKAKTPSPMPKKEPKAHGVPFVNGGKADGVSAELEGQGLSVGTAIVVDGDDDQKGKNNDASKLGREASSANGDSEGEGNGEAFTQRAAKRSTLKRPESPGLRGASTSPPTEVSGSKSPARPHAGRAVEVGDDDSKVPTKAREGGRKSPGPAVGSPSRKMASPTPPTLTGWMARASGTSLMESGETSKGEANGSKGSVGGKDGSKANGDAKDVEEPVEALKPASVPAVSPNSRMTRRKSRSLGKDAGEGGK